MKTVFVIGAGANVEIGMPSGNQLKKEIAGMLDFSSLRRGMVSGNLNIYSAMQHALKNNEQILNIADTIKEAMPHAISIDNFIDAHRNEPGIILCGKLAIMESILLAEKKSYLYSYLSNDNEKILSTWYPLFFQKITEGCDINEFIERIKDISFIIYNYDRCFEYYMIHALCIYYKIGKKIAENIVEKMNIIHPYGTIGGINEMPIDTTLSINQLLYLANNNIRTFAEDSEKTKRERCAIRDIMNNANRVIFLGFAYHPMNLEVLFKYIGIGSTKTVILTEHIQCYGTGFGISEKDRNHIQSLLKETTSRIDQCDISDVSCTQFFNDFWYRLSFRK
ncbi:MAG: hypothetical protein FWD36_03305 [Treponema sp.]|nr:hypothetical protein [Treponema sp.]